MQKLLLYMAITAIIAGCAKDGETGPAGPKGDIGAQGQQGTQGQQGNAGSNGNANVTSGEYILSSWSSVIGIVWSDTIHEARITQGIVDSGLVIVYRKNFNNWSPLPYTNPSGSVFYTMTYSYNVNNVYFTYSSSNSTLPPNPGSVTFKVVVISGTLRMAYPYLDWNNHEAVREVFRLEGVELKQCNEPKK